jgi:hypothetical protein
MTASYKGSKCDQVSEKLNAQNNALISRNPIDGELNIK